MSRSVFVMHVRHYFSNSRETRKNLTGSFPISNFSQWRTDPTLSSDSFPGASLTLAKTGESGQMLLVSPHEMMQIEDAWTRAQELDCERGFVCTTNKMRSVRNGREYNSQLVDTGAIGFCKLDLPLLGSILDYLTVEAILAASSTARVFKSAVAHVSHFLTYNHSGGLMSHPHVWTQFTGAKRVVVRWCESAAAFELLLRQLFDDDSRVPTHMWKELHVGVPGDVFEEQLIEALGHFDYDRDVGDDQEAADDDGYRRVDNFVAGSPRPRSQRDPAAVIRLELVLRALRAGKLAAIEDLDIYSNDTLGWDQAPDDQILAPYEYATDGVKRVMTDILLALPPRVGLRSGLHWGALELCSEVLDANPDLDVDETTPYMDPVLVMWAHSLQFGSRPLHIDLLSQILKRKPDVNVDGHGPLTRQTPLCIATYYLEVDCVEALLDAGADPDAGDQPPLLVCAGLYEKEVLHRIYLGSAGPIFVDEDDFWARRRAPYNTRPLERDYDAHMVQTPKAYRRLYILNKLLEKKVDLYRTFKGLSAFRIVNNEIRSCFCELFQSFRNATPPDANPFAVHLYDVILAELLKMSDRLSEALMDQAKVIPATSKRVPWSQKLHRMRLGVRRLSAGNCRQ